MGIIHSTDTTQAGLYGTEREPGSGSPDVFYIEPVPEGLEHVVYPKYEEAFRLGLEAFSNPMRVNKFYRPLPYILGSDEFQKSSRIVPIPKASNSAMQTPRQAFNGQPRSAFGYQGRASVNDDRINKTQDPSHWTPLDQSTRAQSFENFDEVQDTEDAKNSSDGSVSSGADAEGFINPEKAEGSPTEELLDGGLFDADEEISAALENYRQLHSQAQPSHPSKDSTSTNRRQLNRTISERSQASRDLEQLGKSLNALSIHRSAGKKK